MPTRLIFFLFPLLFLIADFIVRFSLLQLYSSKQLGFYLLSSICSYCVILLNCFLIAKFKERKFLKTFLLLLFSSYLITTYLASLSFFYFNGFYPNYYTFEYFKNEPQSGFLLLKDSIKLFDLLLFSVFFIILFVSIRKLCSTNLKFRFGRWIAVLFILICALQTVFVLNIKKMDQCLVVDSNFTADILRHLTETKSREFQGKGLGYHKDFQLEKTTNKGKFNVIVVLFESLRNQNLQIYGYERNTTPELQKFKSEHIEDFYQFEHPYTVSTTTMLAVPGVLTGITPYQDSNVFYSQPFIWEFGRILNYKTAFLSSHTMKWYHFDHYYQNAQPDYFWNKEKSKFEFFNDLGIKDVHTVDHLNEWISENSKNPFFAVSQFNATHYPYKIPAEFKKWEGRFSDEYDNSILYQDHVIGKLFKKLKEENLLENTVIVFTSDHGESLKDHNNIGHVDSYYIETISVPLMIYLPKKLQGNLDLDQLRENEKSVVSTIDIAPTIVDLLGINKNADVKKIRKNYTGYSLFGEIPKDRYVIQMNNNDVARFKVGISIIQNGFHYIHRINIVPNRQDIYNVKKDPKEKDNLIESVSPVTIKQLISTLKMYPSTEKFLFKN